MMKFFIREERKSIHVYHTDDDVLGHILCDTVLNSPETKFIFFIEHIKVAEVTELAHGL